MAEERKELAGRGAVRRRLLASVAGTAASAALCTLGVGLYARQARALPADAIRPPGARNEDEFLGACVRCGLCVRECPTGSMTMVEEAR